MSMIRMPLFLSHIINWIRFIFIAVAERFAHQSAELQHCVWRMPLLQQGINVCILNWISYLTLGFSLGQNDSLKLFFYFKRNKICFFFLQLVFALFLLFKYYAIIFRLYFNPEIKSGKWKNKTNSWNHCAAFPRGLFFFFLLQFTYWSEHPTESGLLSLLWPVKRTSI